MKPWVVILGVSSGFGAATAKAFARLGHPVFGLHLDRRAAQERVAALKDELEGYGVSVRFHNANAAREEVVEACLDELQEVCAGAESAQVGVLLHSLAFGTLLPFLGEPGAALERRQMTMTLDVMAHSFAFWVQAMVRRSLFAPGARIFAMTSSGSRAIWPSYGAVSAAKAALESHVRQLAVELAPQQITVNAIMAGVCETPALGLIPGAQALKARALASHPHGRLTQPEDVAACLVELARPGTAWMTGNVLCVDGGEAICGGGLGATDLPG